MFLIDPYRTPPSLLTSTPYPIIAGDSLYSFVNPVNGDIFSWDPIELTCTASVVEGDLRIILHKTVTGDNLRSDLAFLEGELRTILHSYAIPAEALTCSIDINAGELRTILKQYQMTAEGIASSASFVDGTLT